MCWPHTLVVSTLLASEVGDQPLFDGPVGKVTRFIADGCHSGRCVLDSIEAEQSPVFPLSVVGDEVPVAVPEDVSVRLDQAFADSAVLVGVSEAQVMPVSDRFRQRAKQGPVGWPSGGSKHLSRHGCCGCSAAQGRWQKLFQLGADGWRGGVRGSRFQDEQPGDEGADLVGVQQQGRDLDAGHQSVATPWTRSGPDVVAQSSQSGDVAPKCPEREVQVVRQLLGRPCSTGLEQRQQPK